MDSETKIVAVQRMQDFIQEHLQDPITLNDLARAADLSPSFASRTFKELIGKNPFDYIRRLRVSQAALRLRDDSPKIIDVAFDYLFDSHEGFTRAFSKSFGITPSAYRKETPPIRLFIPYRLHTHFHLKKTGGQHMTRESSLEKTESPNVKNTVFVQVIERPARKLILKRGLHARDYYEYCAEVGCDVWGILSSIKEALYEPVGLWLPDHLIRRGTSQYAMGVELPPDYQGVVPEGFDCIDLAPCKMMVFQGPPFEEERFENAITDLWKTIEIYQPEMYGYQWAASDAPRFQMEPQGYRGYIEGRPVRTIQSEKRR